MDKIIGMFALLLLTALGVGLNAATFGRTGRGRRRRRRHHRGAVARLRSIVLTAAAAALGRWGQTFAALALGQ